MARGICESNPNLNIRVVETEHSFKTSECSIESI